jgi:glycosyltransferase involved in cell wall biosynthesis
MGLNILHIVAGDLSGGAARGAYWIHKGLLSIGIKSKMIVQNYHGVNPTIDAISHTTLSSGLKLIKTQVDTLPLKLYANHEKSMFSTGITGFDIRKLDAYKWADIVHLHWINNGMINIKLLNKIDKPIVWTMRDMWPMTGGCHYAMECKGYENRCGCCYKLKSHHKYDLSRYVLNRKKRFYPKDLHFVAISSWLAECAKSSYLLNGYNIDIIPNSVDTLEFFSIDKNISREILGLPINKKIVLAGAINISNESKGFTGFKKSFIHLDKNIFYVFFGNINETYIKNLGIPYKLLGYLKDNVSLRIAYSAADVFVAPSIQEAFGKTIIEAMACGTPVVAFDATGPKDIVEHKQTGYLAKPFDSEDLGRGINWILENNERLDILSSKSQKRIEKNFSTNIIAKKYVELYEKILA